MYSIILTSVLISILFTCVNGSILTHHRPKRQSSCTKNEFACDDGQCIDAIAQCDGIRNCKDGSDETNVCKNYGCYGYLFACNYGACIEKEKVCNGVSDCADNSDETNCSKNVTIQSGVCNAEQFQCFDNRQCIGSEKACNGRADCNDASDESVAACSKQSCPGYTYRCRYGACVDKFAFCNGIKECHDGSDETDPNCKQPAGAATFVPPTTSFKDKCILPKYPENGGYQVAGDSRKQYRPGDSVSSQTFLTYECRNGFKLRPFPFPNSQFCNGNKWDPPQAPVCESHCPIPWLPPTTEFNCTLNGYPISCNDTISGAELNYQCALYHEDGNRKTHGTRKCLEGYWNYDIPKCVPACGQEFVKGVKLSINGKIVERGKYPWQAVVYFQGTQICGGALLNSRVVLSAAHCFTNDPDGALLPLENYEIAVGKYFRDRNSNNDSNAQYSTIESIYKSENYRGIARNFQHDFAIVLVKKAFSFSNFVIPVCLDEGKNFFLQPEQIGAVSGYGFTTSYGDPSVVLRELEVPYVEPNTCRKYLDHEFENRYYTADKFCAGFHNKNISVCKGDSGGALSFKIKDRYYIKGIVSVSPSIGDSNSCDPNQYSLYTDIHVNEYFSVINDYYARYLVPRQ